jgi:hypothetical protein
MKLHFASLFFYLVTIPFFILYVIGRIRLFRVIRITRKIVAEDPDIPKNNKALDAFIDKIKMKFEKAAPKKITGAVFFNTEQLEPIIETFCPYKRIDLAYDGTPLKTNKVAIFLFMFTLVMIGLAALMLAAVFGFILISVPERSGLGFCLLFVTSVCITSFSEIMLTKRKHLINNLYKYIAVFVILFLAASWAVNHFVLKWNLNF